MGVFPGDLGDGSVPIQVPKVPKESCSDKGYNHQDRLIFKHSPIFQVHPVAHVKKINKIIPSKQT